MNEKISIINSIFLIFVVNTVLPQKIFLLCWIIVGNEYRELVKMGRCTPWLVYLSVLVCHGSMFFFNSITVSQQYTAAVSRDATDNTDGSSTASNNVSAKTYVSAENYF